MAVRQHGGGVVYETTMLYDVLGRKTELDDPDAGHRRTYYNPAGEIVREIDAKGQCIQTSRDFSGRPLKVSDFAASSGGACSGDVLGESSFVYDGQRLGQVDSSTTTLAGQQISQTLNYYDAFSRPISMKRCTQPETISALWCHVEKTRYDRFGRVAWVADASSENLVENSNDPVAGEIYRGTRMWYGDGNATTADGVVVAAGFQYRVSEIAGTQGVPPQAWFEVLDTNSRGQVTYERIRGDDRYRTQREYTAAMGRQQSIRTGTGPVELQDLYYVFDEVGNLRLRRDNSDNFAVEESSEFISENEDPGYDALNRLFRTRLKVNGQAQGLLTTRYSANGNIVSKQGNGYYSHANVDSYSYGTTANHGSGCNAGGPHAVSAIHRFNNARTYCYDANGNQTISRDGAGQTVRQIAYTVFDKPSRIDSKEVGGPGHSTLYRYDAGRSWLSRVDAPIYAGTAALNGELEVLYQGAVELEIRRTGGSASSTTSVGLRYQRQIGGVAIQTLTRQATIAGENIQLAPISDRTLDLLFKDHIGSSHLVLRVDSDTGNELERQYLGFDAWGMRRVAGNGQSMSLATAYEWHTPTDPNDTRTRKGFTGHEMVDGAGIIHMGGRIYDPLLGRFLQADPIIQEPLNSQSYNRYTYVFNNPLSYTDPTGYRSLKDNIQRHWRTAAAVVITIVTWGQAAPLMAAANAAASAGAAATAASLTMQAGTWVVAGGAAAGYVSTGTLRGAVMGAVEAGVSFGIHVNIPFAKNPVGNVVAHSLKGGTIASFNGGDFGHGFASAGLSKIAGIGIAGSGIENPVGQIVLASLARGVISKATGGKFESGAVSSAIQFAFNQVMDYVDGRWRALDDFGQEKPEGDFFLFTRADGKRAWVDRHYVGEAVLYDYTGPPPGFVVKLMEMASVYGTAQAQGSFGIFVGQLEVSGRVGIQGGVWSVYLGGGVQWPPTKWKFEHGGIKDPVAHGGGQGGAASGVTGKLSLTLTRSSSTTYRISYSLSQSGMQLKSGVGTEGSNRISLTVGYTW